jgi:large subunit ribosomal protein L20
MPRARVGAARHRRHKRALKAASGYYGQRSIQFRIAKEAVRRAGVYAYRHRRLRKRDMRALWIARLAAACGTRGLTYSQFMGGLKKARILVNRKMLSELAIHEPAAFDKIVQAARAFIKVAVA